MAGRAGRARVRDAGEASRDVSCPEIVVARARSSMQAHRNLFPAGPRILHHFRGGCTPGCGCRPVSFVTGRRGLRTGALSPSRAGGRPRATILRRVSQAPVSAAASSAVTSGRYVRPECVSTSTQSLESAGPGSRVGSSRSSGMGRLTGGRDRASVNVRQGRAYHNGRPIGRPDCLNGWPNRRRGHTNSEQVFTGVEAYQRQVDHMGYIRRRSRALIGLDVAPNLTSISRVHDGGDAD